MSSTDLKSAVYTLYHDTNKEAQRKANYWLEEWQRSEGAWAVCYEVLGDAQGDLETFYFAAQTLRTKILRDFEELGHTIGRKLPDDVLGLLSIHAKGPGAVRTQLCLAVAALAMHIPSAEWAGGDFVTWIGQKLLSGAYTDESARHILLEILTVLPQEAGSYQPSIVPERRRQIEDELQHSLPQALNLLCIVSDKAGGKTADQVLEAFAAWLLGWEQGCTVCGDGMQASVMGLLPRFHICIQQAVEEQTGTASPEGILHDNYEEEAKAIARLFAEVGEAYAYLISEATPEVMGPVEALLDVCRYPDMEVCSVSFNFWHRLSYILSSGKKPHSLKWEGPALPEQEAQRRLDAFCPSFKRLVEILSRRIEYPVDWDGWHRDEKNDFKYNRMVVGDLLLDSTDVLGADACMSVLTAPLSELSSNVRAGGTFDWRKAEACLYSLRSIHKAASSVRDPTTLVSLLSALPSLPSFPHLDYSVAVLLGSYAEWMAEAANANEGVRPLVSTSVQLMIKGLGNEHTSSACALSLRNICESCATLLSDSVPLLLELYRQVQNQGDISQAREANFLDEEEVESVLEAVTFVVSSMPQDLKRSTVQQMIDSVVHPIQVILDPLRNPQYVARDQSQLLMVLPLFERVTTILKTIDDPEDVAITLEKIMPWINVALSVFAADAMASEKICRVPRYAVRSAKQATYRSLPSLSESLTQRFEQTKHSCYLYVASELVKAFGHDPAQDGYIKPMLHRMLVSSCSMLTSLQAVTSYPELTDDMFLLAGRGLSYAPRLMMTQELLSSMVPTSRNALLIQHKEACASVSAFLVRLLDPETHRKCDAQQVKALEMTFYPYGGVITQLALAGGVGALPPSRMYNWWTSCTPC
eukprot:jgi/Picre1/30436/NNA_005800.t1